MNKRGSHVGVILSFIIFVTFLFFVYSIIEPTIKVQRDKQALLDYLKIELKNKFSAELTIATVNINRKNIPQSCVELENFINNTEMYPPFIISKNEFGEIETSNISNDGLDLRITRQNTDTYFFKIYNSSEFKEVDESSGPCFTVKEKQSNDNYTLGLVRTNEYFFETKVLNLINIYANDYENLKEELKIPVGSEFGFSLTYSNGTIIGTEEKNISVSIYAEESPIQYVDNKANILSGFVTIRVW